MDPTQNRIVDHKNFNLHVPINLGAVMLVVFLLVGAGIGYFVAKQTSTPKDKKTLSIIGVGVVQAKPDSVGISVYYEEKDYLNIQQATEDLNSKQVEILKVLTPFNVPKESVVFTPNKSSKGLYPSPSISSGVQTGYLDVLVTLKGANVEKAEQIKSALESVSLVSSSEITKSVEYKYEHKAKAREDALKDAQNQLNVLMQKNKLKVDKIVSFKETSEETGNYYDGRGTPPIGDKIPLGPGEETVPITASYEIIYSLN